MSTRPSRVVTRTKRVLKDITFEVTKGEYVSIIGHSGCGKSTLLNIVAGLAAGSEGGVLLEGHEVDEPGPDRAVVFQNHSLLPWLTVYDNVRARGRQGVRVEQVARRTPRLDTAQSRSGADDARASQAASRNFRRHEATCRIARALAMEPKLLLLDEPFGALDALTRAHLQDTVMGLHQKLGNTVMMITHDVDEAVLLSDRIIMMTNGPSAQIGEILEVPLSRPRKRLDLVTNATFLKCRQRVLEFLYERHRFVEAA